MSAARDLIVEFKYTLLSWYNRWESSTVDTQIALQAASETKVSHVETSKISKNNITLFFQ